nr:MAG TPA: hypothetical protein [Caudoviricetes sp.]
MNRIPKNFYRVTARVTEDSTATGGIRKDDLLEIYSNDFGLLAYNNRNNTYYYIDKDFYRNCLKVLEVVK